MGQSNGQQRHGIFVSYRRSDSAGSTGRLADSLRYLCSQHPLLSTYTVFIDVDGINPGEDFVVKLERALDSSAVLLAVIGTTWVGGPGRSGQGRLHDTNDFVGLEITTALDYAVPVIPVLVDGAAMLDSDDLPEDLTALARRQAFTLSHAQWTPDVERLLQAIIRAMEGSVQAARSRITEASQIATRSAPDTSGAYDPELYQPRLSAEAVFKQFVADYASRALLFVGRAGDGKTVLLSRLYRQPGEAGALGVWYQAAEWREPGDLARALAAQLPPAGDGTLLARLRAIDRVLQRAEADYPAVLFVDGVNEADDPAAFTHDLTDLLYQMESLPRVRVVVSCREETFARYPFVQKQFWTRAEVSGGAAGGARTYGGSSGRRPDSHAVRLGAFTPEQLADMWQSYAQRFSTTPSAFDKLPPQARELAARNPLMLRLVAEAFSKHTVPEGVSSLVVFRAYFDYFVEGDPQHRALPTTVGERQLLDVLVGLLADLEQGTVRRRIPRAELEAEASRLDISWDTYQTLQNKGVLQEHNAPERGKRGTTPYVAFAFDRMFEFALAVRLHEQRYEARGADLEHLVHLGLDYAGLWGAARTLILLELERRIRLDPPTGSVVEKAAAWLATLLDESRGGVRGLVTDALVQLGYEDPPLVEALCSALLESGRGVAGHVGVAVAVQCGFADVLLRGCRLRDRQTRRRAAQGAIYLWQRDQQRGVELWRRLGEQARAEVGRSFGSWGAIAVSAVSVFSSVVQSFSLDQAQEQIERRAPSFVALWHVCFIAHALGIGDPTVTQPLQAALRIIIKDHLGDSSHGRLLNWLTKATCAHLYAAAMRASGMYDALERELDELRRDEELRVACVRLVQAWVDRTPPLPAADLEPHLVAAARGGWLAGYAILGALMAQMRRNPDDAVNLALRLTNSEDDWTSFQGLVAAGALVPTAIALGLVGQVPTQHDWFKRLALSLEQHARRVFERRAPPLLVSGLTSLPLNLGHVFLAKVLATGDLMPLVEELRASARTIGDDGEKYLLGEVEIIRGLGNLPRVGQAAAAPDALTLWQQAESGDEHDRVVFDTLAETLAEMLAAFPDSLEGWLERSRNPALEARVREKLLTVDPDQVVYNYGLYMMVIFGANPETARKLVPVMEQILEPAKDMEHAVRLLGELLFDPDQMPFLW